MPQNLRPQGQFPSRVVLIGGSGFVGRHVAKALLSNGMETLCLSSKEANLLDARCADYLCDRLKQEDTVVFLSCLTPDKGKDSETMLKNMEMAVTFEKVLLKNKISHLIYISSDAVYENASGLISERTPPGSTSFYGYAHILRELILKSACQTRNIPCLVVRPVAIYGSGDSHNSYGPNRFIRNAMENKVIQLFGAGEEKRDHLYIADLSDILMRCIGHMSTGTLNIASGKSISFMNAAKAVRQMFKETISSDIEIRTNPRQGGVAHRYFDNTDLIRLFPSLSFTSFERGVQETIADLSKAVRVS